MKVVIRETNEEKELKIICTQSGCEYTADFVGNAGGFINGDFERDDESGDLLCSQETFEWWDRVINENQELDYKIFDLKEEFGSEAIDEVLHDIDCDLEDFASVANDCLNKFESEKFN